MKLNKYMSGAAVAALSFAFVSEAAATEWNVSVWEDQWRIHNERKLWRSVQEP